MTGVVSSDDVDLIAPAWVAALNEFGEAKRDAEGNWGAYASIGSVIATVQPVLARHGLAAHQVAGQDEAGRVVIRTRVWHTSGQWIEAGDGLHLTVPPDPQKVLSALTYGRRGEAMAFFGLAPGGDARDDDGQAANDAVVEMTEASVRVGKAIKALTPDQREALSEWVRAAGRSWPVMPKHLHTDPNWTAQLADHLGLDEQ